jgi:hypothetical protein
LPISTSSPAPPAKLTPVVRVGLAVMVSFPLPPMTASMLSFTLSPSPRMNTLGMRGPASLTRVRITGAGVPSLARLSSEMRSPPVRAEKSAVSLPAPPS